MIEWFDDLAIGMRVKSDEVQIAESDIKRFAADAQPMHLDEVAAADTAFKEIGEAFPERLPTSYRHIRAADVVGIENSL